MQAGAKAVVQIHVVERCAINTGLHNPGVGPGNYIGADGSPFKSKARFR
ncbi:MAG: hypothetical protein JWL90_1394, partial [Chthoniobacteraceae bacterium]|nr:hypothetical protein [Chthoniobacteraceae bacterium]